MGLVLTGSLTVEEPEIVEDDLPVIGYHNLLREHPGQVVVSSAQEDHPRELVHDGFTDTAWIGETGESEWWVEIDEVGDEPVNYAALTAWELSGVTVTLERSDDGETWTEHAAPVMGTDEDRVLLFVFDEEQRTAWRFRFQAAEPPEVADVSVGQLLQLEPGFQPGWEPPPLARDHRVMNNKTETGRHVGRRVIRRGVASTFELTLVDSEWMRDEWEPFADHAELHPFYLAWAPKSWPEEVAFLHTRGELPRPRYTHAVGWMSVSLDVRGVT